MPNSPFQFSFDRGNNEVNGEGRRWQRGQNAWINLRCRNYDRQFVGFFLWALELVTQACEAQALWIFLLPTLGLCIGLLYHRLGRRLEEGTDLLLEEIHQPKEPLPWPLVPAVFSGTLLTHLGGGSAGREGTAVQMGGALADQLSRCFSLTASERRSLILTGLSAGFGSVFGVPFAGAVFGLEVTGSPSVRNGGGCMLAALIAHYTCLIWGTHHSVFNDIELKDASVRKPATF